MTTSWFDEVITPEERLDVVEAHGQFLWAVIGFTEFLQEVLIPTVEEMG